MRISSISDCTIGDAIRGFFLCNFKSVRYAKNGNLFLDMVLSDASGKINAKMWEFADQFDARFDVGDPVAVKGEIVHYNKEIQLTVKNINKVSSSRYERYGYSNKLLVKHIDESIELLWVRLTRIVNKINNPYKKLIFSILKRYKKKITIIPFSTSPHQIVQGSLLKHIVLGAEMGLKLLSFYPKLNKDLALCGLILFNIGKVKIFDYDFFVINKEINQFIDHKILGRDIVREFASDLKFFSSKLLLEIEYMFVLNNEKSKSAGHGVKSELLFVRYIDEFVCKMNFI